MDKPTLIKKIIADSKSGDPLKTQWAKEAAKDIVNNKGQIPSKYLQSTGPTWDIKQLTENFKNSKPSDVNNPNGKIKLSSKIQELETQFNTKKAVADRNAAFDTSIKNDLDTYSKASNLIKDAYTKYSTGSAEEYLQSIRKASTFIRNNEDKFADVEEVENFYDLPGLAIMKSLGINPEQFKAEFKKYRALPSDKRLKDPFRKKLAEVGAEYAGLGLVDSQLYDAETRITFLNAMRKKDSSLSEKYNILEAEAIRLADSVVGSAYKQANEPKIAKLDSLESNLKEADLKIREYVNLVEDVNRTFTPKLKKVPKTKEEYNSLKKIEADYKKAFNSVNSELIKYQNYAKGLNSEYTKIANDLEDDDIELMTSRNGFDNQFEYQAKYYNDIKDEIVNEVATNFTHGSNLLSTLDILTKGKFRENIAKRVVTTALNSGIRTYNSLTGLAYSAGFGDVLERAAYKANQLNSELTYYTGDIDADGNKVLSNQIRWKDSKGDSHISFGAIAEEGAQQLKMMAGTGAITKIFARMASGLLKGASVVSSSSNIAKGLRMGDLSANAILKSKYGANLLTAPAVYLSTFGRTYYENMGKFGSEEELMQHTRVMSGIEAITESFVPDVKFLEGMDTPIIGKVLSKKDYARLTKMLTSGKSRKEVLKRFGATLTTSAKNLFQEAIVEEELNYLMQGGYDKVMGQFKGEENYLKHNEELSVEGAINTGIDSLLTMSLTMLVGAKNNYKNISRNIGYDLNKPEMLDYHRYNIGSNANAFRNIIAEDKTLTAEQRAKAFSLIDKHEANLKTAVESVKRPSNKTLGPDQDRIFMYFKALNDKETLELKVANGEASKEDLEKYETVEKTLATIDQQSKDWSKLTDKEKEKTWFKWKKEGTLNTEEQGLANSPTLQYANLQASKKAVDKLYKSGGLTTDMYKKYLEHFEEVQKEIFTNAKQNVESNLEKTSEMSEQQLNLMRLDIISAKAMLNNAEVSDYALEQEILSPEVKTIVEALNDTDNIVEISYLDRRNKEKTQRFRLLGNKLVTVNSLEPAERMERIFNANVLKPVYSPNTNKEMSEDFLESSLTRLQEAKKALQESNNLPKDGTVPEPPTVDDAPVDNPPVDNPPTTVDDDSTETVTNWESIFATSDLAERKKAIEAYTLEDSELEDKIAELEAYKAGLKNPTKGKLAGIDSVLKSLKDRLPKQEEEASETGAEDEVSDFEQRKKLSLDSINEDGLFGYYYSVIPDENDPMTMFMGEEITGDSVEEIRAEIEKRFEDESKPKEDEKPEQVHVDIDEVDGVYSDSFRPVSALITISDEYDSKDKKNADPYVAPINKFLNKFKDSIGQYKGKLVSFGKFLRDTGVDVDAVRTIINNYWKNPSKEAADDAYLELLGHLKGRMPTDAIKWLLAETDKFSPAMSEVYGITNSKDKFDLITMRSFTFAMTDENGNYLKVNNDGVPDEAGVTYVTRAIPKVNKDGEFYNVNPLAPDAIRDAAKELYSVQEVFKDNEDLEIPVTNLQVSNGFNSSDFVKNPPVGRVNVQLEHAPVSGLEKGRAYDSDGNKVFTNPLSELDINVLAHILAKPKLTKAENDYINSIVFLSDEVKNSLKGKSVKEISEVLATKHYNISTKLLSTGGKIMVKSVENGQVVDSHEIPYTSYIEEKWYTVTPKPSVINGNRKIYFEFETSEPSSEASTETETVVSEEQPVESLSSVEQSAEDILNNAEFEYSTKNAPVEINSIQELKAYSWFISSFLSKGIGFNYSFLEHPTAFATFTNTAITLYKGSDNTMLYHEAWHRFTQNFLTPEAKNELYAALKSIISEKKLVANEKLKYEEALAEGFRSLMLSGGKVATINVNGKEIKIVMSEEIKEEEPLRNWFSKLYNFFKTMFTDKKTGAQVTGKQLIAKYFKEASHPTTTRVSDPANNMFKTLNTDRIKHLDTKDGQRVYLDYRAMHELNMGLDALFVKYFNELPKFKELEAMGRKVTFTTMALQKKEVRNAAGKIIYEAIRKELEANAAKARNKQKKLEYQAVLDNFEKIIESAEGIRKVYSSAYQEIVSEKITDQEITGEEHKLEIADTYETKLSQQELASEEIINLVRLIPQTDKKGNFAKSSSWGLPYLSDFTENWLVLANNLTTLTYPEMYAKVKELSETTHPRFKNLLENLPNPESSLNLPMNTFELKLQFEQVFNMPKVDEMITILADDENAPGSMLVKFTEAGTSATREVVSQWKNDTDAIPYDEMFKGFEDITTLSSFPKMLDFLAQVGIVFTERKEVTKRLKGKKGADFETAVIRVYKHLAALKSKGVKLDSPVEAIEKTYKKFKLKGEGKSLDLLANLEVETNDTISDDMILRADGERNWKYNQFNYLTKLTNALDSMSYEELVEIYPNFDVAKNPGIVNSPWFRQLFNVLPSGTIQRNDRTSLEFVKTGGLKSEVLEDSDGTVTVDLTATDKLVMDFYSFAVSGIEENVKFGDKATAGAMNLKGVERIPVQNKDALLIRLVDQLVGEIKYIKHLGEFKFPSNSKQFKYTDPNKGDRFAFFRKMLSDDLKKDLLEAELQQVNGKWELVDKELMADVVNELKDYFNNVVFEGSKNKKSFKSAILAAYPDDVDLAKITPEIYDQESGEKVRYSLDDTMLWYYMYSVSNRIDQFNLLYGDPRNYKNGSDVYKRLSAYSATGKFPSVAKEDLQKVNVGGRQLEQLVSPNKRNWTSKFNVVQFKNLAVNLPELGRDLNDNLKKAWADYIGPDKGDKADASGAATLDFYRGINMLIGTWDSKQENAYKDQVEFVKAKMQYESGDTSAKKAYDEARAKAKESYKELLVVFNPKKWQYAGSIYSTHTVANNIDMRAFLKFAIMPIIPSNVEGTELEKVANSMYKTNTDMYIFGSGSKMTIDQKEQSFQDWVDGNADDFNPTVLDLRNFKEQLPIENKMKEEGIFASQMRKLLSVGQYENGKPIEGKDISNYSRYEKAVENITTIAKEELKSKITSKEKLIKFLENEFEKRDMPEHVKDFLKFYTEDGVLVDGLDISFQSFFIQSTLFSIINNRLIKQRYSGGQFVQLPNLGYRKANFIENAEYGADDLKFYQTFDGKPTIEMEIKIAFSDKYKPLLNLIHPDGEVIGTLDRLNSAISDPDFIKEHGKKFTMIGCRIPVQGFSTIEAMRVAKFLDPIAGQVVIVPNGLTIKSGSDFDIDKLNIYEPHLDSDGDLIDLGIGVETNVKAERDFLISEMEAWQLEVEATKKFIKESSENFKATDDYVDILTQLDELENEFTVDDLLSKFNEEAEAKPSKNEELIKLLKEKKKLSEKQAKDLKAEIAVLQDRINDIRTNISANRRAIKNMMSSEINALIQSVTNIVLEQSNAENLITKNELDYVIGAYEGLGIPVNKDDSTLDISEIIDVLSSNTVTENNNSAKSTLGIAAKSNTIFAMFLKAGMKVMKPSPTSMDQNIKNGVLSLSSLNTKPYSGRSDKYKQHLGPMYIPKLLSEFISATVDVANDNRVGDTRFSFNKFVAPMYIYGVMRGTHLYDLTDMVSNPTVQKFIKEYLRLDSISYQHYINSNVSSPRDRMRLLNKNLLIEKTVKEIVPQAMWQYEERETSKGIKQIFNSELTLAAVIQLQYKPTLDFANFIFLKNDSSQLSELSAAASWDTNTSKSFVEFEYSKQQMNEIKNTGFFEAEAVSALERSSVIAPLNVNEFVQETFAPLFSLISSDTFMARVIKLYNKTNRVKLETFTKDYTNDFLTFLFQNNAEFEDGSKMYDIVELFLDKNNEYNIENQIRSLKERVPAIADNMFLKALKFKKSKNSKWVSPILRNANVDVHTLNIYHEEMRKLLESQYSTDPELNAEIADVFDMLIKSTALLNGVNKTFGSFIEIIPTDVYTSTLRHVLSKGVSKEMYDLFEQRFMYVRQNKHFKDLMLEFPKDFPKLDKLNKFNYFYSDLNTLSLQDMEDSSETPKVLEGDIFSFNGIPVITTNLPGVHGAGLAQLAKNKGLITQGDGAFKATNDVVQLPVKGRMPSTRRPNAGAYSESVTGENLTLLQEGLDSLVEVAKNNPENTYLLPLAGLGHGEGNVADILPMLINTIKSAKNITLVMPTEDINTGRKGTVRKDNSKNYLTQIKEILKSEGLLVETFTEDNSDAQELSDILGETEDKDLENAIKLLDSKIPEPKTNNVDYKYYGANYTVVIENGIGVDVVDYKGKNANKQKLLDAFNNDPMHRDPQAVKQTFEQPAIVESKPNPTDLIFTFKDGKSIKTPFKLNSQQEEALHKLADFVQNPESYNSVITLEGYAGTGKTSIIGIFHEYLKSKYISPIYTSPTHRANAVTKLKNPRARVMTLHKMFGLAGTLDLDSGATNYSIEDFTFNQVNKVKVTEKDFIIVDESSMVTDELYDFLMMNKDAMDVRIIFVGDRAQLKPVGSKGVSKVFVGDNNIQLTKVERTGDNPVLEEATTIREGGSLSLITDVVDGYGVEYVRSTNDQNRILAEGFLSEAFKNNKMSFRALAAKTVIVKELNSRVREMIIDNPSEQIVKGELLMGYSNFNVDYNTGEPLIMNSGDYEVDSFKESKKDLNVLGKKITLKGFDVTLKNLMNNDDRKKYIFIVNNSEFDENKQALEMIANGVTELNIMGAKAMKYDRREAAEYFSQARKLESEVATMRELRDSEGRIKVKKTLDYGYAMTIHKSQGGTYDEVVIDEQSISKPFDDDSQRQLTYVAVTRAAKKVNIFTNKTIDKSNTEKSCK